jgi:fructose transport system substrate-binding protein
LNCSTSLRFAITFPLLVSMDPARRERPRTKTSRRAVAILVASLALAFGCSCKSGGPAGGPLLIGVVTKTETNPFFVKLREAAAARAHQRGAEVIALAGRFEGDSEGQVTAIESLVSKGVRGILVTPSNSSAILGAVKRARDKGILVTALDTATEPADAVEGTFATDNREAGRLQGAWLRAALAGRAAKVVMLNGTPGSTVDTARRNGFLQGFGIQDGDAAIVGRADAYGDQAKAQAAMENLLQAHPDVTVVYTINEPTARGAYAAIAARGKQGAILIGSIDGGCGGVADVKEGRLGATVMQFPKKMAEEGVDAVLEYARTGKRPVGFVDTGAVLITDRPQPGLAAENTAFGLASCWG